MILTDREIRIAIEKKQIYVSPSPPQEAFSSTSLDLTLDQNLSIYKDPTAGVEQVIDPAAQDLDHETVLDELTNKNEIPDGGYVLNRGNLILGWTAETITLPVSARLAARVEGKSLGEIWSWNSPNSSDHSRGV